MIARILDGKAAAAAVRADLKQRVADMAGRGIVPGLGTVLVGDDPGSRTYVAGKHRDCDEAGITGIRRDLPATASQADVATAIDELNADPSCTGYIVQLPLPAGLDTGALLERVSPDKDADGLHPTNLGRMVLGGSSPASESTGSRVGPLPCTARAVHELLRRYDVPIERADVTVIGRGVTVGRPLGLLLTQRGEDATVTMCHTKTADLAAHARRADIVVAAAGVPGLVTADMVKPGAVVLDVGITRQERKLVGDVDPGVRKVAGALAPVPGGVGPMTRAMLLRNVVEMAGSWS